MVNQEQNRSGAWSLQNIKQAGSQRAGEHANEGTWLTKADEQDIPVSPVDTLNVPIAEQEIDRLNECTSASSLKQRISSSMADAASERDRTEVVVKLISEDGPPETD